MWFDVLILAGLLAGSIVLDGLVKPRRGLLTALFGRSLAGLWLQLWLTLGLFGLFLACSGNAAVSAGFAFGLLALLVVASNAKHQVLGEPLLFSDLALVGAIFRHPQFYLSAVKVWQRVVAGVAALVLAGVLWKLFVPNPAAHLIGLGLVACSFAVIALSLAYTPIRNLAPEPDAYADVRHLGLLPSLLLYWLRWRATQHPPQYEQPAHQRTEVAVSPPELVVVIQCESFADPCELFGDPELALPGLNAACKSALQWGRLEVSGFGAYTMRTEYGVLFGRSEEELGFRRYDPFLTALGDVSYALPAKLATAGLRSIFVHPHDMRFYGRNRIMPAAGFAELVGEERFARPAPHEGRYVTDAALAAQIMELARAAREPSLLYAVTIENHGPWSKDKALGDGSQTHRYLRLARNSDAMLTTLLDQLAALQRPALLAFFGDHRPSIPGVTQPHGPRHTPYVIMRMDGAGNIMPGDNRRVDLTPAQLHHIIVDAVLGRHFKA